MKRFMVCAAFLYLSTLALAQSGADPATGPNPAFGLNGYEVAPLATLAPFGSAHSCNGRNTDSIPRASSTDLSHIFHVPCLDLKSQPFLIARNEIPFVQPQRPWPNAKAEPIPTQWPKVRMEPIPTQWPDMKMEPISGPAKAKP